MNNQRRKQLKDIKSELLNIQQRLKDLMDEEQQAFDNLSDSLQCSERGEKMEDAISNMDYSYDSITDAIKEIDEIK